MKKVICTLIMVIAVSIMAFAQPPQAFKYQAVARDNTGNVLANQSVLFRISILQGVNGGTLVYSETHLVYTNQFGLVNLKIGNGTLLSGVFTDIDWGGDISFLQIEMDETGGNGYYVLMGTSQLLSVPYSLYSEATGDTTRWKKINDDLYFNTGSVGIGTDDPGTWAKLNVNGNLLVEDGNAIIKHTDATETSLNIYNTVSDWELVAAPDNNRFDFRKYGEVPALSISDNNYIGIGTTAPAGILDIAGAYHFPAFDGTNGQVLQTDGSGTLSWSNSGGGANEINDLTDGRTIGNSVFLGSSAGANDNGTENQNVAVGIEALTADSSGAYNTAIGYNALKYNTTGYYNTANGNKALRSNTTGQRNTANGYQSLFWNTTGNDNTANGYQSLRTNTTGEENTANGYRSLFSNTTGHRNTANGFQALHDNTTGDYNTAIGNQSLYSNTTANYNTAIGDRSLYSNTTGYYNTANGHASLYSNMTGYSNTANGFQSLYSDTTGYKNTANGFWSLYSNTTGYSNTANGTESLYSNTTGWGNTANGNRALYNNTTGSSNVAIGTDALYSSTDRSNNVAVGDSALYNNGMGATGSNQSMTNTAIGSKALYSNTTGWDNTANGYQSLYSNTTQRGNTANGCESLYFNTGPANTAIGWQSLYFNTTGGVNTAIGYLSLTNNTEGDNNTANGYFSLRYNTTGSYNAGSGTGSLHYNITGDYNTAIGYFAGVGDGYTNLSNTTAIGDHATVTASNEVRVGNTSVTSIGGYAPWTDLSDGRYKTNILENVSGLDFIMGLRPVTYNLKVEQLAEKLGENVEIDEHGNKIQRTLNPAISAARKEKASQRNTGFIAQEVEALSEGLGFEFSGVDAPKNDSDFYGLRYATFVVPLVKAVQEQQEMIKTQQELIEKLNAENAEFRTRIENLENR